MVEITEQCEHLCHILRLVGATESDG